MVKRKRLTVPSELRTRLEITRRELLALFRALDGLDITPEEMPQEELHELFELDADFAEALYVMDQPPADLDSEAMVNDTLASLEELPQARRDLLDLLPLRTRRPLAEAEAKILASLTTEDAYHSIPGRDPQIS
jgi:uncharacterized protein (DUF2236 family)